MKLKFYMGAAITAMSTYTLMPEAYAQTGQSSVNANDTGDSAQRSVTNERVFRDYSSDAQEVFRVLDDHSGNEEQNWSSKTAAYRDGWIEGRLHYLISSQALLAEQDIALFFDDNTVFVTGSVDSALLKDMVTQLVAYVPGVAKVQNRLAVTDKTPEMDAKGETAGGSSYVKNVAKQADIRAFFAKSRALRDLNIRVSVDDNAATLTGTVDDEKHKALAEAIALTHPGIHYVVNQVRVSS